jgi:16S rRNA (uracil1498-N3)-methyltransferase
MAAYDFKSPRLYLDARFAAGAEVPLEATQANYLLNVLRLKRGEAVLAFNGRDGEWRTALAGTGKRSAALRLEERVREQTAACDLAFLFAPLKHARLDYMVQKAVEMGVAYLQPVITRHTQVARVNLERMRANAIEAAEQCGILALPQIEEPRPLPAAIAALKSERLLVFCDEEANGKDPVAALRAQRPLPSALAPAAPLPMAVLIGPEGGFAKEERELLLGRPNLVRLSLGPRILRADTAAVAGLALVQTVLGDWAGGA